MAPTVAEIIAQTRAALVGKGDRAETTDPGSFEKLTLFVSGALEQAQKANAASLATFKSEISDMLHDQVIEGQQALRKDATRKGGWNTLDNADVYERLIDPAGLTMEQKLVMPDSQLRKYVDTATYERVKIYQELNDDALILGWIMALKSNKGGGAVKFDNIHDYMKSTRTWKALQAVSKSLTSTGANAGVDWIPTQFSTQLIDIITVSLKIAPNFARITIPQNTFKIPIATSDDIAFLVSETNSDNLLDDANAYPKFTPATANQTFQAIKIASIVVFSEESEEDSIVPLLPFVRSKIANAMANAQERATLDGDTTNTHMDFDVTAATDARKAWKGLRYRDKTTATTTKDLSTFNLDNVRGMRELLTPAFAENPDSLFYATSVKVMLKLLKFPEFITVEKYGPAATVITGEIGKIDGSPLLTSKYSRDDVAATGVNTTGGPNTKSLLYLQDRRGYWYGDRREIRIDQGRMLISGQGFMVVSQRVDFKDIYVVSSTVNKHGALGINI